MSFGKGALLWLIGIPLPIILLFRRLYAPLVTSAIAVPFTAIAGVIPAERRRADRMTHVFA